MKLLPKKSNAEFDKNKNKILKYFLLYSFIAITLLTMVRSLIHSFAPDGGANIIAGIKEFNSDADETIYSIFSLWGWAQLGFGLLYILILIRYRNLIPLMFVFLFIEYVGRLFLGLIKKEIPDSAIDGTPPGGWLNYFMIAFTLITLIWIILDNKFFTKNKSS